MLKSLVASIFLFQVMVLQAENWDLTDFQAGRCRFIQTNLILTADPNAVCVTQNTLEIESLFESLAIYIHNFALSQMVAHGADPLTPLSAANIDSLNATINLIVAKFGESVRAALNTYVNTATAAITQISRAPNSAAAQNLATEWAISTGPQASLAMGAAFLRFLILGSELPSFVLNLNTINLLESQIAVGYYSIVNNDPTSDQGTKINSATSLNTNSYNPARAAARSAGDIVAPSLERSEVLLNMMQNSKTKKCKKRC